MSASPLAETLTALLRLDAAVLSVGPDSLLEALDVPERSCLIERICRQGAGVESYNDQDLAQFHAVVWQASALLERLTILRHTTGAQLVCLQRARNQPALQMTGSTIARLG